MIEIRGSEPVNRQISHEILTPSKNTTVSHIFLVLIFAFPLEVRRPIERLVIPFIREEAMRTIS